MLSRIRKNYEFYKKRYFRGDDIYCPFCSGFYKAQKFSITKESSTVCPVCSSTADERTVLLFLLARTRLLSGDLNVLIIAEEGVLTHYFENFPNAVVRKYSTRGDFIIRDQRGMDFDAGSFDIIVCNYILEKHSSPPVLLKDITRLLKPDGIAIIQANVDENREETAEYSHMYYKDRLLLYDIPGNMRRYGKDYGDILKSFGLNMSKLRFSSGFESLPEFSLDKNEILYIAHKSKKPELTDNMDELESEMEGQRSNEPGNKASALIYTAFFILPELVRKSIFSLRGKVSEREENKGTLLYMLYVLLVGEVSYWGGLILFKSALYMRFPGAVYVFLFIVLPLYVILSCFGLFVIGGYFMTNFHAGILKKLAVGMVMSLTILLGVFAGFA
ncbi:MAG: class I SAM-dependent methyltransferase [Candidatus Delongbacteria bacterium]|nr:class I SAM-dependent methyltransferase [Candidatus Delongbacteria bacterium]